MTAATEHAALPPVRRRKTPRGILLLVGLALVGAVGWGVRARTRAHRAAAAAASAERTIPVQVARVERRDVPVVLEGLGNVVPLATVQVRTQVDGRLVTVAFKEGQKVARGDLLAQVDPRPFVIQLHNAEAALLRDEAQLRNALLNLERYRTLRQQNLIPQQQVDDQRTLADQADATVRADRAQIESARLNLDYARIVSPTDGVVGVRQVDPGNIVHTTDTTGIVTVTQLDPITVLFTLPQDELPRVAAAMARGPVPVDALSREGAQKLESGTLSVIDNQVNTTTATIRLKATFPNPKQVLWPNAFVKARVLVEVAKDALVVAPTVVQHGPNGTFAYVVGPDGDATPRPIDVGLVTGDLAIVTKGLAPGEQVVTDGQNQLRPGAKVAPRPASGAGDGGERQSTP